MQENCISHVQRTDNILMRSTKDRCLPPPFPLFENYSTPFPFLKNILRDFAYICCLSWVIQQKKSFYLQQSARRSGMPDPWNWSPNKCTTQHPRKSHFWCTKSQVWSGWKTIAEIQKGLRLNNALLIKTRTMQRTTGKFVSWFLSPYFIEDNIWKIHSFTNLLRRSIIWPIYNYCRFTETQKHQVCTLYIIFNNINTIMHTGLQSFLIYHLTFVRTMYGTCLSF